MIQYSYVYKDEERYNVKSTMVIGALDHSLYSGNISWYPIVHQRFMTIKITDVLFNNVSFNYCGKGDGCYLTADSGLSYMAVPEKYMKVLEDKKITPSQDCDPKV